MLAIARDKASDAARSARRSDYFRAPNQILVSHNVRQEGGCQTDDGRQ